MHKSDNSMGGRHLRDGRSGIAEGASMKDVIAFILGNFTLTFFALGLLASAIALWRARPPRSFALIVEALFSYFVLFSIGFSKPLQFRLARLFRETGGELHRMGGQSLPVGGGLCQPRLCAGGIVGVQGKLRFAARGNRRACRLSLGRGRRSRLSDDHGAQFRARQCRRHFLQRYLGSDGRLHISVAATPRGPIAAAKVSVKAKTPVEAVALSGR